ncbi:MAG: L-2-hydroxyglutarate oxidase [Candidatus Omnitrophica bacterium]|nr:L-2-hydroxyglutarate oxidase [Candidatus Omnitrophota bacterium]
MQSNDVVIIGAGIVGLATAYNLAQEYPDKSILVLEKENQVAQHQTGHNSGVLHSGIYYKPGSLKAINCREGKKTMEAFCEKQGIPFKRCGKVIVAVDAGEQERLGALYDRGQANGVDCTLIDQARLRELEPHVAGLQAIHVRETGIVDYRQVCERLAAILAERGHRVMTGARVVGIKEYATEVVVQCPQAEFHTRYAVNCAGLYSDRITALGGSTPPARIIPFRGEYYEIKPEAAHVCNALIYPVADPRFPFLGVHFTRMISGHVECGPNAVFAFAREGYRKTDLNLGELLSNLTFPGFIRMTARYWRTGVGEMWRSLSKPAFVKALQRLIPDIRDEYLVPAAAGVRAQAVTAEGNLLDDFAFCETARIVNVINAPSPAATASLSIGKSVVEKLAKRFYK